MRLSRQDAYILKQVMSRQPINEQDVTPLMRLLLDAIQPDSEIGYKRLSATLAASQDMLLAIMAEDPMRPLDIEQRIINANRLKFMRTPAYLVDEYPFYPFHLNALVGASGSGKSFVALDFAARFAAALDAGSVMYIAAEGLAGYASRWEAWKQHNQQAPNNLEFFTTAVNFMDAGQVELFAQEAAPYRPVMLIIDTVARCMVGADENSVRDISIFIDNVQKVAALLGSGVLLVHHTGKNGTMRGSSALFGACDSVVMLNRVDRRISLHNEGDKGGKNKFLPEAASRHLEFLPVEITIGDAVHESAVLVDASNVVQTVDDGLSNNQQILLDAMKEAGGGITAKILTEITGLKPATVYRNLGRLRSLGYVYQEGDYYYATNDPIPKDSIPF